MAWHEASGYGEMSSSHKLIEVLVGSLAKLLFQKLMVF